MKKMNPQTLTKLQNEAMIKGLSRTEAKKLAKKFEAETAKRGYSYSLQRFKSAIA